MDSDLWISCLMAAKRQYALQSAQTNHATTASHRDRFGYDDIEPEDEVRPDFPCPYCYEDQDITSLCAHLEVEHPFESKAVSCPVCSARVSKDLLDHITLQHGYLFRLQRHQRLRRVAVPCNSALSLAGKDLQETYLKVLLGNSSRTSGTNTSSSVTDSLLSSLVLNLSSSEAEDRAKPSAPAVVENSWFKRHHLRRLGRQVPNPTLVTKRGSEGGIELP